MISASEKLTSGEERVKHSEGGTLGYEESGRETPQNEKPRPEQSSTKKSGHQEPCERPSEKPPEQPREKDEQQTKRPQRWYMCGLYANYPTTSPLNSQKNNNKNVAAYTKNGRGTDGGYSGVSGGADHTQTCFDPRRHERVGERAGVDGDADDQR